MIEWRHLCRLNRSSSVPVAFRLQFSRSSVVVRQSFSQSVRLTFLTGLLSGLALLSNGACRQGIPVIDPGPKPDVAAGTISGTVRGPAGTSAIEGRTVEVINVETGARERVTTNNAGGFTFKVRPGKYRVELTLMEGEKLVKQPGVINVNRSDVDAHADFVIAASRIARPRFAAPRFDNGLGPPIA
jgi:Carboxypeptidase regulatory-like domain